jgi:hypothetical protein
VKQIVTLLVAVPLGLLLGACSKDNDRPPVTAVEKTPNQIGAEAPGPATASASESIAESRCEREQRCDNIGDQKKFSSKSDCLARIRADWKDDLNARECPAGVNSTQLRECLTAIRGEDCNSPFDTLSRVSACTSGQICQG